MIPSENPDRFQISALSLWLIFFLVLLAVNSRCLFHPPYWDGVTGVFFQGQWLRTNSFDFGALAQQAGFAEGGPRIYAYNAVAPAYAFALSILPPSTVNLLAHVLVIAFSAATLTLFASILRRYCPTPDTLLWTSVVALNPMFSGQTAAIYLEIPLAFTFLLVIEALSTNRLALAVLVCALSFTIKPTALLLAASIAAWSVFSALIGHPLAKNRRFVDWCLFFAPLTAGFLLFGEFAVGASTQRLPLSEKFNSLLWTAGNGLILDVIPLALGLLVGAIVVSSAVKRERLNQDQQGLALLSLCAITSWGFWASLIVVSYPLCRYVVVVTAPSLLLLALGLKELLPQKICRVVALMLIVLYASNQYGAWLPPLHLSVARSGERLERSREFLVDQDQCIELCQLIERDYPNEIIVARRPFVQMLTLPEFGYVRSAHQNVLCAGFVPHELRARHLPEESIQKVLALRPLVIYSPTVFELLFNQSLTPPEGSDVLFSRFCKGSPLLLYRPPPPPK